MTALGYASNPRKFHPLATQSRCEPVANSTRFAAGGASDERQSPVVAGQNRPMVGEEGEARIRQACFELVLILVSQAFEVEVRLLKSRRRHVQSICLARQVAMYLLHTSFSVTYREIGRFFLRDRTTISHGCSVVEDLRDDPGFDRQVEKIEAALLPLQAVAPLAGGPGKGQSA